MIFRDLEQLPRRRDAQIRNCATVWDTIYEAVDASGYSPGRPRWVLTRAQGHDLVSDAKFAHTHSAAVGALDQRITRETDKSGSTRIRGLERTRCLTAVRLIQRNFGLYRIWGTFRVSVELSTLVLSVIGDRHVDIGNKSQVEKCGALWRDANETCLRQVIALTGIQCEYKAYDSTILAYGSKW